MQRGAVNTEMNYDLGSETDKTENTEGAAGTYFLP
jgi:hypothetical protein